MSLRIDQLRHVVKATLSENAAELILRHELVEAFGVGLDVRAPLNELAAIANDELVIMGRRDIAPKRDVKPSVLLKFIGHPDSEVRRLVARLLPERFLSKMLRDGDDSVRSLAASRVPLNELRAAARYHSRDEILTEALENRNPPGTQSITPSGRRSLREMLLTEELADDVEMTMTHEDNERLGDAVKQAGAAASPDLSDAYYDNLAEKFVMDYDVRVIESNWRPTVVRRFASATRATSGVVIDEEKLRKAIDELIEEREKASETSRSHDLARLAIRESINNLNRRAAGLAVAMPIIEVASDPAADLLESNASSGEYVRRFNELYAVRESTVPAGVRKFRLGEGNAHAGTIPAKARTPGNRAMTESDEHALDLFVETWNRRQALDGEPIRIAWYPAPHAVGAIGFEAILR